MKAYDIKNTIERMVKEGVYKGVMPKGTSPKKMLPLFNDTPRHMRGSRGMTRSTDPFYVIHNFYDDMQTRVDRWKELEPCKCGHKGMWHMDILPPYNCIEEGCKCKMYRKVSLEKYTDGMFKTKWYNFTWRFRGVNW